MRLRQRTSAEAATWDVLEAEILGFLQEAAIATGLDEAARRKYFASATAQEIHAAFARMTEPGRAIAFIRNLPSQPPGGHPAVQDCLDSSEVGRADTRALKDFVRARLGPQVHECNVSWTDEGVTSEHLPEFREAVQRALERAIVADLDARAQVDPLDLEIERHAETSRARRCIFIGRQSERDTIEQYLRGEGGRALILSGQRGIGRSALAATAADLARQVRPAADVYLRFVGTTEHSSRQVQLVLSLCEEIARTRGVAPPPKNSQWRDHERWLARNLDLAGSDRPVVMVVDSLERLSSPLATHTPAWLPRAFPLGVWCILTTTPGIHARGLHQYFRNAESLEIGPLSDDECRELLDLRLRKASHSVRPEQHAAIVGAFKQEGLPLWGDLNFNRISALRSSDPAGGWGPELKDAILQMLAELSSPERHGSRFVRTCLGYLTAARFGLGETELLEIIADDTELMADFRARNPHAPPLDRMPELLWARLRSDLGENLATRGITGAEVLQPVHDVMSEVISQSILDGEDGPGIRSRLVEFFGNRPGAPTVEGGSLPSARAVGEILHGLAALEDWGGLSRALQDRDTLYVASAFDSVHLHWLFSKLAREADIDPRAVLREAIESPEANPPHARVAAVVLKRFGHLEESLRIHEGLIEVHSGEMTRPLATDMGNAGDLARALGRSDDALAFSARAIEAFQALGELEDVAMALGNRGLMLTEFGKPGQALALHRREERILRFHGSWEALGICLGLEARAYQALGQLAQALPLVRQKLALFKKEGSYLVPEALLHHAELEYSLGRELYSADSAREAEGCYRSQQNLAKAAEAIILRARSYVGLDEPAQALRVLKDALGPLASRDRELFVENTAMAAAILHLCGEERLARSMIAETAAVDDLDLVSESYKRELNGFRRVAGQIQKIPWRTTKLDATIARRWRGKLKGDDVDDREAEASEDLTIAIVSSVDRFFRGDDDNLPGPFPKHALAEIELIAFLTVAVAVPVTVSPEIEPSWQRVRAQVERYVVYECDRRYRAAVGKRLVEDAGRVLDIYKGAGTDVDGDRENLFWERVTRLVERPAELADGQRTMLAAVVSRLTREGIESLRWALLGER